MRIPEGKIKQYTEFPTPKTPKQIKSQLASINFFRTFLPNWSEITLPLHKQSYAEKLQWKEEEEACFQAIKRAVRTAGALLIPQKGWQYVCTARATSETLNFDVAQMDPQGNIHPVGFHSRLTDAAEKNYSPYRLIVCAILYGIENFKFFFDLQKKIQIYANIKSALLLRIAKDSNTALARNALSLMAYNIEIIHVPEEHPLDDLVLSKINKSLDVPESERKECVKPLTSDQCTNLLSRMQLTHSAFSVDEVRDILRADKLPTLLQQKLTASRRVIPFIGSQRPTLEIQAVNHPANAFLPEARPYWQHIVGVSGPTEIPPPSLPPSHTPPTVHAPTSQQLELGALTKRKPKQPVQVTVVRATHVENPVTESTLAPAQSEETNQPGLHLQPGAVRPVVPQPVAGPPVAAHAAPGGHQPAHLVENILPPDMFADLVVNTSPPTTPVVARGRTRKSTCLEPERRSDRLAGRRRRSVSFSSLPPTSSRSRSQPLRSPPPPTPPEQQPFEDIITLPDSTEVFTSGAPVAAQQLPPLYIQVPKGPETPPGSPPPPDEDGETHTQVPLAPASPPASPPPPAQEVEPDFSANLPELVRATLHRILGETDAALSDSSSKATRREGPEVRQPSPLSDV